MISRRNRLVYQKGEGGQKTLKLTFNIKKSNIIQLFLLAIRFLEEHLDYLNLEIRLFFLFEHDQNTAQKGYHRHFQIKIRGKIDLLAGDFGHHAENGADKTKPP